MSSDRIVYKLNQTKRYKSNWRRVVRFMAQCALLRPVLRGSLRVKVEGKKNLRALDTKKPYIVVANHSSHLDMPIIHCTMPLKMSSRLAGAAANDYWFGGLLPRKFTRLLFNTFPVDRKGEKQYGGLASRLLDDGVPVAIMPEGKRSRTGKMGEFLPGAARLSIEKDIPVVPVTLIGTHAAWRPGRPIWRVGCPIKVIFGEVLQPGGLSIDSFNKKIKSTIKKNLGS